MSRTDKDRPSWVKANDYTLELGYDHNHVIFGKIERWSNPDSKLIYRYMDYCTAFDVVPVRPDYVDGRIFGKDKLGKRERWEYPCVRYENRRHSNKWMSGADYPTHIIRPKKRDFLKSQVRRFNSNYDAYDDYGFMDEDAFPPRAYWAGEKW